MLQWVDSGLDGSQIARAYQLSQELRDFFNTKTGKGVALTKLAHWYDKVEKSGFKSFTTIMNTIRINDDGIVNYFENRSTNAAAESFNAKIKAFRAQFRGVTNVGFFLFRLTHHGVAAKLDLWVIFFQVPRNMT